MKKVVRVFSRVAAVLGALAVLAVLLFFLLIVAGASPRLQTIWICSAMRTMSHKYLATVFFSDDYIRKVMKANEVDDSAHDSDLLNFAVPAGTEDSPAAENAPVSDAAAEALKSLREDSGRTDPEKAEPAEVDPPAGSGLPAETDPDAAAVEEKTEAEEPPDPAKEENGGEEAEGDPTADGNEETADAEKAEAYLRSVGMEWHYDR